MPVRAPSTIEAIPFPAYGGAMPPARISRWIRNALTMSLGAALLGCSSSRDGALDIAIIGDEETMFAGGVRLPPAAQHLRAAMREGLVGIDQNGEILPALADRWIITDDGRSYIFRLRDGTWPDGRDLTGDSARDALRAAIRELRGTSLGLDLAPIEEVRAMAGRVIEVRLTSPMPDMLQLLAQPELGLKRGEGEPGPLAMVRNEGDAGPMAVLSFLPPEMRGLPEQADWNENVRLLRVDALPARTAIERFDEGTVDVVLNGQMQSFPLVETGPLSRGTVRLDGTSGLFGLLVLRAEGVLAQPALREALAMAIDRDRVIGEFNVGGWLPQTRVVPASISTLATGERWAEQTLEERRAEAGGRIAAWREGQEEAPLLRIAIPEGPGGDLLFAEIASDFSAIGLRSQRVKPGETADLRLIDRLARYAAPRWFLNQFNCVLRNGLCSPEADSMLAEALQEQDATARAKLLEDAETELTNANVFLPIASPLRWSLVRGSVYGFAANRWGFHPLPPMATIPR